MATDEEFQAAVAEAIKAQSVSVSNTSRSKTNFSPLQLLEAQRLSAKIAKPAVRRKFKISD
jgi:hypothetical protein